MDTETFQVRLITPDKTFIQAQLHIQVMDQTKQTMKMVLKYNDREIETISDSYFFGLHPLRRELEKEGLLLACYGASRNVWTSGMAESMGLGFKVYKLISEQHPDRKNLVVIFNEGLDLNPVTLAEQEAFHTQWIESIGRK